MGPLLDLGRRKTLDLDDVPFLDDNDSVHGVLPNFKAKIASNSSTGQFTDVTTDKLVKVLVLTTWKLILVTAVYALLSTVAAYVGPYLIEYFVDYLNKSSRSTKEGYILVLIFVIAQFIEGFSTRHLQFRSKQVGVRACSSLVATIYQKCLALSNQSRQSNSTGEMINVVSLDAECVGNFSRSMHDVWLLPVQIVLGMLILYSALGLAAFAALAATVLTMVANIPLGTIEQNYQEKTMTAKDARMRAMSEILCNLRILKLQGWDMIFLSKIKELRKVEMNWLKKNVYTSAMLLSVFFCAPAFVAMVTFGTCVLLGIPLETGKVLSALATFRQLQTPIHGLPDAVSMIIQTKVSLDRISSILCLEELPDAVTKLPRGTTDVSIEECLLGFLASKTVVYVTHHVEFLPSADVIMVLKDGKITQAGDYTEIVNSGEEFTELIVSHKDALSTMDMLEIPSSIGSSFDHNVSGSTPSIAETAGLAVTYGLSLSMLQGWAIAVLCSLENRMISVERILQYMTIPSEPPLIISESMPGCQWPTKGEIELRNLHVRFLNFICFV
ncbi:hypothetical protein ACQ4PT_070390 [Festuca glaucescens]